MTEFALHPRLQQDCWHVGDFALSRLLLMNDSQYPWFILVPRRPAITEIFQLEASERRQLLDESCLLAETLQTLYRPDKLNIAAIGNLVPQLHLHHVVRYQTDRAWPAPVWGKFDAMPYPEAEARARIAQLTDHLEGALR
mgnify:CR=1 FL=1